MIVSNMSTLQASIEGSTDGVVVGTTGAVGLGVLAVGLGVETGEDVVVVGWGGLGSGTGLGPVRKKDVNIYIITYTQSL